MSWSAGDVKRLKEEYGQGRQLEYYFYPILAAWIEGGSSTSRAFIGYKMDSPQVDVVEVTTSGKITGYEVKLPHIGRERSARALQVTYIVQGIGQALEYLIHGFDRAYLVTLHIGAYTEYLQRLMERTVPFLGLIIISKNLHIRRVRAAERTHFYDEGSRRHVGWIYAMRWREKGPVPSSLRQYLDGWENADSKPKDGEGRVSALYGKESASARSLP